MGEIFRPARFAPAASRDELGRRYHRLNWRGESGILGVSHHITRSPLFMSSVLRPPAPVQPTNSVPLARLFACPQGLGFERWLARPQARGLDVGAQLAV